MSVAAKICGLSSEAAVAAAVEGGAAYVGFVFYPPSPRAVSPARCGALCAMVPGGVPRVGLFVDPDDATIAAVLDAAPAIDILQLHGAETPERVAEARQRFGRKVMKAVAVAGPDDLAVAARYEDAADLLLFDAKPPPGATRPGGNGLAFDWRLIAGRDWRVPWLLSGGLTADLLPEAVRISRATAVDVSSGVETAPGQKDPQKIRAFITAAAAL
ncbi:MAG: phosphoribosylanthranilate isomerase [Alphaproteobacteria bacterium]|nr:phosphoribosylanthranilate isomerase [Alphaproteobacteria bacterium]